MTFSLGLSAPLSARLLALAGPCFVGLLSVTGCAPTAGAVHPPARMAPAASAPVVAPIPPPLPAGVLSVESGAEEPETAEEEGHEDGEGPDDEDSPDGAVVSPTTATSPLLALSDAEAQARYKKDPTSLGPISVGRPNAGALVNGVVMPQNPAKWIVLEPGLAWGTQETVDAIAKAIDRVHSEHPNTAPIPIGHISSKHGGYLPVHKSHQAGRDVDIGYYFTTPKGAFISGTAKNLDLARNLTFIKAMFAVSDVEMMFIDTSIQKLLVEYALSHGEDSAWLDKMFQVRQKAGFAPIRHVRGHKNHIHVRYVSPVASAMGRKIAGMVAIHSAPPSGGKGAPVPAAAVGEKLVAHRARSGDTLQILAKRYGTSIEAIKRANALKGDALKAGHVYQIPVPALPKPGSPLPQTAHKPSKPAPQKQPKKGKSGG
ncbi:MAG: penicillin-insensitive murein endopeptidase [Polyangiaceae bacterium]|nr:penicillin-insensitive murein endopeptidase [Polyangiaceae bacterium]